MADVVAWKNANQAVPLILFCSKSDVLGDKVCCMCTRSRSCEDSP
jgi:hypothetical protein